jgi:uncharacterized protein YcfJ
MKTATTLMAMSLLAATNMAAADNSFYDRARVLESKPVYETVRVNHPEERCWNEQVYHRGRGSSDSYTPTIAGAILGGVVGNQFGKGSGKDAMTVAGALLGGSIGNDVGSTPRRGYTTTERRCEMVDHFSDQDELVGYRVKYRYNDKVFWTRTKSDPGRYIRVQVSVAPAEGGGYTFQRYD